MFSPDDCSGSEDPADSLLVPSASGTTTGIEGRILFITKRPTYMRTYPSTEEITSSDILRLELAQNNGTEMLNIGRNQGGNSFQVLPSEEQSLSPSHYVINYYGERLQRISGYSLNSLQIQTHAYSIGYMIYHYFDSVDFPQKDDLVFYANFRIEDNPSVGIFKEGNSVISKYDSNSPYVFQHELFFVPFFYGEQAIFYRLKKDPIIPEIPLAPQLTLEMHSIPYIILEDFFSYKPPTSYTEDLRNQYGISGIDMDGFPYIEPLKYIQFSGVCYDYAFGKFLNTYVIPKDIPIIRGSNNSIIGKLNNSILMKYFDTTIRPEEGDLAVYFDLSNKPVHYGIMLAENLIESKWGQMNVFRHAYFDVPFYYGHKLKFLKLKLGLSKEMFRANLRLNQEEPPFTKTFKTPVILNEDETGSRLLLLFSYKKPTIIQPRRKAEHLIEKWSTLNRGKFLSC